MLSVAVPSSFSGRGVFSGADIVNDNFGAGLCQCPASLSVLTRKASQK